MNADECGRSKGLGPFRRLVAIDLSYIYPLGHYLYICMHYCPKVRYNLAPYVATRHCLRELIAAEMDIPVLQTQAIVCV